MHSCRHRYACVSPLCGAASSAPCGFIPGVAGRFEYVLIPKVRKPVMGSVIKKRRKRMSKKKHRKMLRRTRVQRRKLGK